MPKKSRPNKRGRPVRQDIDRDMIRKLAMIGCSHQEIANRVGCSRETLEQRFRSEIEEGQSDGQVQARAKIFQKGVVNGEFASLELYLINQCGWSRKPEVQVTTNVVQTAGAPRRSEAEIKAHLVELQRAVWAEARRLENEQNQQQQLPPASS